MAFFDHELEAAILAKRWETDCSEMILTQNEVPNGRVYRGKGYIRQNAEGAISFRIYPPTDGPPDGAFDSLSQRMTAGRLIPPEEFYSLSATDWYGRVWTCSHVHPQISTTSLSGKFYGTISGEVFDVKCVTDEFYVGKSYRLRMIWNVEVTIQCNANTEVTTRLGDRETRSGTHNVALFPFGDGKFRIWTNSKQLYLEFESETTTPHEHFFVRVMETMSFILGRRLGWNYVEEWRNGSKSLRARGVDQADERNLPEPLRDSVMDISGDTWRLFADYLQHILPHEGGNLHPVSALLFQVYQARQGTIDAQALALGVAIEGLCKQSFPLPPETESRLKGWVRSLRQHCDGWPGFQDEETHAALYQRVSGLLGQLPGVRAKDILMTLVSQGAVSDAHTRAWSKLRNAAAHASLSPQSMQELIDLCAANRVLLYHLVFKAIGYRGTYTDYSEHGHPTKQYGPSPTPIASTRTDPDPSTTPAPPL